MSKQAVQPRQIESFSLSLSRHDRLNVALGTDIGLVRAQQEDAIRWCMNPDSGVHAHLGVIFVLADGMGGHAAGEIASHMAVETIVNTYFQDPRLDISRSLRRAMDTASQKLYLASRRVRQDGRLRMGTTTTAAVLCGRELHVAHVGDSRAYLVHQARIRQLTVDHSWVQEQLRRGLLKPTEARNHPRRNIITRSLGQRALANADYYPARLLEHGDVVLLCSDGLSAQVSDLEICRIVSQARPEKAVGLLLDAANQHGGGDNASVVVIQFEGPPTDSLPSIGARIQSWLKGDHS